MVELQNALYYQVEIWISDVKIAFYNVVGLFV